LTKNPKNIRSRAQLIPQRYEMSKNREKPGKAGAVKAELRPDHQESGLACQFDEGLEKIGNFFWQKMIKAFFIASGFEFPFLGYAIDEETGNFLNQHSNNAQLGNNRSTAKRSNRRIAKNASVFFESAVSSFRSSAKRKELLIAFGSSGNFENKARVLSDGGMSRIAKLFAAMRTVLVTGIAIRNSGFDALLETGKGNAFSQRIKAIGTSGKMAMGSIRPSIAVKASFKESFSSNFFISDVITDQRDCAILAGMAVII
jgi:hypothetical protein